MFNANNDEENWNQSCDDVRTLLKKWDLLQLEHKFKEHEISIQSLLLLTSEDICELIPKIGPRAIFRARLHEWQKYNHNLFYDKTNKTFSADVDHSQKGATVLQPPSSSALVKTELNSELNDTEVLYPETSSSRQLVEYDSEQNLINRSETPPSLVDGINDHPSFMTTACENDIHERKETKRERFPQQQGDDDTKSISYGSIDINPNMDIRSALMRDPEGRQALRFYATNRKLDFKYRRVITSLVINLAVDKKIWLCCKEFQRMANEINQIFPNESSLTYYMPRVGIQSPRGALYNKYLNMSRKLRLEGRLEYRRHRSTTTSSHTMSPIKKSRFY